MDYDIALRRMEHHVIAVASTASMIAELSRDYRTYTQIMRGTKL
jgi:hypothetical protein